MIMIINRALVVTATTWYDHMITTVVQVVAADSCQTLAITRPSSRENIALQTAKGAKR
jgi:hypothetical protein